LESFRENEMVQVPLDDVSPMNSDSHPSINTDKHTTSKVKDKIHSNHSNSNNSPNDIQLTILNN